MTGASGSFGTMGQENVKICLLGGVEARTPEGATIDLGPPKCRALLAALALNAGTSVPTWRLIESVWGDNPPQSAERTLQSYIARLRRALGTDRISRQGSAYRLELGPDAVDALAFTRLLESGNVSDALAEWKGTPLAGVEAPGLEATVVALSESWLGAVETDLSRRVDMDPAGEIGRLTELTASHPYREGLWALLMTALYRVDRQADALAAYQTARAQLVEHLGVEPGERLQELELRILSHDSRLSLAERPGRPQPRPTGTVTFAFAEVEHAEQGWVDEPEKMAEAAGHLRELAADLATDTAGFLVNTSGDSVGAAFGRATNAARWADRLQDETDKEIWPSGYRLRIGIHTGEAEEHEGSYYGPAVNTALRLASVGHGRQTLLSGAAASLLDDRPLRDLGVYRLRGLVSEQPIHQLGTDEFPALRTGERHRSNLPRRLGRLVGREHQLTAVDVALKSYPVVTLVGPGGIGKTRLALEIATRFRSDRDTWIVELAEIDDPAQLPRAFADALAITEHDGAGVTDSIVRTLKTRNALVILDNCEHVLAAAAEMARRIVEGCTDVVVVATSRERLGITNERIITVPPLDPDGSAADLFEERAEAASPLFDPGTDRPAVIEICHRLDGIPLAIELAAARVASLSPPDLAARLRGRLGVLDGSRRSGANRHRTLEAAIDWSYDLLSPTEQDLFRQLSVFTGPFSLSAAEFLAAGIDNVAAGVGSLVERSLLSAESGAFGRLFRMLEPIRQFGMAILIDRGEESTVTARHTKWCLTAVENIGRAISGWDEVEGVARLEELWPNLRAAVDRACEHGDAISAVNMIRPIISEIVLRSNTEIGDWAARVIEMEPGEHVLGYYAYALRCGISADPAAFDRLVATYPPPGGPLIRHGRAVAAEDYDTMTRTAMDAARSLRSLGMGHLAEQADINLTAAWMNTGQFSECDARLEELTFRYRNQGPPTFVNWTLMLSGYSALFQGMVERADSLFEAAMEIEVPARTYTPNKPLEARSAFRSGDHVRAFTILHDHVDELLATDNVQAASVDCIEFINMMTGVGRTDDAARILTYVESTGLLDTPEWRALVTPVEMPQGEPEPPLSDREALGHMRRVLADLIDGATTNGATTN